VLSGRAVRTRSQTPTKLIHRHQTLEVPNAGARLVLVADTHSAPHPESATHIAAQHPTHILHGGDIGDLAVLAKLAKLANLTAVRGNIDVHAHDLPDAVTIDVRDLDGPLVTLLLVHIAVYGPKLRADIAKLARTEGASVVVCGHSHVPFIGRDKGIVIVNPGSIGPRRFQLPIVFAVMDVSRERISMHHVSCETGQRWEP
jgi:putative phosphoesterase